MRSHLPGLAALLSLLALALAPGVLRADEKAPGAPPIAALVKQLGDRDFVVRQQAQEALAKLGFEAYDALSTATRDGDLEIASRARYLLGLMRMHWSQPSDPPEVRRCLEKYELQHSDGRLLRIGDLARLRNGAGIPALCRLVRFEASELFSKYAAIEILNWEPADRAGQDRLAELLRKELAESKRTAAQWLLGYGELRENLAASEAAWMKQVQSEEALARSSPGESNGYIIASLLYHLAEAQGKQEQSPQPPSKKADATAERARQLNPGTRPMQLYMHLEIAKALQHRGRFAWADEEYHQVIRAGNPEAAFHAQLTRAEMWHDQRADLDAADAIKQALRLLDQAGPNGLRFGPSDAATLRARMDFFLACYWEEQGNRVQQLKHLEEALKADPTEIDVLIACTQLKEATPELRKRVRAGVERAAAKLRSELRNRPEDADARRELANDYNQLAWLLGNTKTDLDEALRHSQKSLELSPNNGAYYDTLAHVYFAKGDLENAVKHQARAVELEPHSGLIQRELIHFRAEWERQKGQAASPPSEQPATGQ